MTKQETAKRLEVSLRTLERMMAAGEIEFSTRHNPRGGSVSIFSQEEIDRVRAEREKRAATVRHHPTAALEARNGTAIATNGHRADQLAELVRLLIEALSKRDTTAALHELPCLTREQAAVVSGLSKAMIYRAVASGELRHIRPGRRIQVKRSDLVSWVDSL